MKRLTDLLVCCAAVCILCGSLAAQQPEAASVVVPQLMTFSAKAADPEGKPIAGIVGVTFAIYKDQFEGAPLWSEIQNITADSNGKFTAQLGASTPNGLPLDVFSSGEARWLGVRINGGEEQPRVMLLSVPYALKAADAQTLGGLPASAFALAVPASSSTQAASDVTPTISSPGNAPQSAPPPGTVTGSGTADFIPLWTTTSTIGNSMLFQLGTGATGRVGIGTDKPGSTLDVKGAATIRGVFALPATGVATATAGANSQPQTLAASSFNSTTSTPVAQTFEWMAEAVGNNTATASGSLNLLYGQGTSKPSETGLNISSKGLITFATGQKFPGTGTITGITTANGSGLSGGVNGGAANLGLITTCTANQVLEWTGNAWNCSTITGGGGGSVTSVGLSAPSSDFTVSGSPVTKSGTLALNWAVAPTSANTANAIVKRDSLGNFSAATITASNANLTDLFSSNGGNAYVPIYGVDNAASGSSTAAVYGGSPYNFGVWGSSSSGYGVYGTSTSGVGIYGASTSSGGVYGTSSTYPGIWGASGSSNAVFGANSATGEDAVRGDSFNPNKAGVAAFNWELYGTAFYSFAQLFSTSAYFDGEEGHCLVDAYGNLQCTGTKSAVVPVDGGSRQVALYAVEAPENWFEDAGSGQLLNGTAIVELEPTFAQTVNTGTDYHVFLTPNGDCNGLYVSQKSPTSFAVRELSGGTSNVAFDYRVMVKRKGYENIRLADETRTFAQHRVHPKPRPGTPPPLPQQMSTPRPATTGRPGIALVNSATSPKP